MTTKNHLGRMGLLTATPLVLALAVNACGDSDETPVGGGGSAAAGGTSAGGTGGTATGGTGATAGSGGSGTGGGTSGTGGTSAGGTGGTGGTAGAAGAPPSDYEGFGAVAQGHASCPTTPSDVHVTSLDDSGPGTLREALSDGCRNIVFDLGGTITLASDLNIRYSHITVDGATAPSPGITIVQPGTIGTTIEARSSTGPAHDIIIRYLRMDGQAQGHDNAGDIWGLDGESAPVYNVIIDHVTGIASTDGVFDVWEDVKDVTLSWNLILDTITALHLSTGDVAQTRERFSIHHNVFARNNERQIRLRHNTQMIDYVNNVIYGWAWMESGGKGVDIAYDAGEVNPSIRIVGNVFHYVPGLSGDEDDAIVFNRGSDEGAVYFEDNALPAGEGDNTSTGTAPSIPASAQVTQYPTSSLGTNVVPLAGTHFPTSEEQTLLQQIASEL